MEICRWVRAGLRDYLFEAIIVGEPAPTGITIDRKISKVRAGLRDYLFEAIIIGEPAPTGITINRKISKASTINC
jgi:hypothetical protein